MVAMKRIDFFDAGLVRGGVRVACQFQMGPSTVSRSRLDSILCSESSGVHGDPYLRAEDAESPPDRDPSQTKGLLFMYADLIVMWSLKNGDVDQRFAESYNSA